MSYIESIKFKNRLVLIELDLEFHKERIAANMKAGQAIQTDWHRKDYVKLLAELEGMHLEIAEYPEIVFR